MVIRIRTFCPSWIYGLGLPFGIFKLFFHGLLNFLSLHQFVVTMTVSLQPMFTIFGVHIGDGEYIFVLIHMSPVCFCLDAGDLDLKRWI
jgi:hypothetical protein